MRLAAAWNIATCRPCEKSCTARRRASIASSRSSWVLFQVTLSESGKRRAQLQVRQLRSKRRNPGMFNTRKHLSRRTLLKGAGATLALPLLDAMIPASTAMAQTAARPSTRLGFVYFAHGALQDEW